MTRGTVSALLTLPRPLAFAIFVVVVLFVGFGAYGSYRVYSYTQNDPSFCKSCHTMENAWNKWATSEHSKVNCHNCHEASPIDSMNQVIQYAMNNPNEVSKHANVPAETCKRCHASNNPEWKQIAETAGHKVHAEEQRISCLKCHSVSLHRFAPPEKICLACHSKEDMTYSSMGQRYCLDCHNFLRENSPLQPQRQDCLKCHESQTQKEVHWPTNAPMQFQCGQCHKPHTNERPTSACASCHPNQNTKGKHAVRTHASATCNTCHKPHEWKVTQREACLSCHQDKTAHNQGTFCGSCHSFR